MSSPGPTPEKTCGKALNSFAEIHADQPLYTAQIILSFYQKQMDSQRI